MKSNEDIKLKLAPDLDFREILTNPILDIAARFWESDRYAAFRICYRSMRVIDDLVDDRKAGGVTVTPEERLKYAELMTSWLEGTRRREAGDDLQEELLQTIDRFHIPLWPWQRLIRAMIYDLTHSGYRSFTTFLRYAEGAAVAPASVFMHLCGVESRDGKYAAPTFDVRKAARPLAIFSYLVHIMRDFQKDHQNNLNYFSDGILRDSGITLAELAVIANGGGISPGFRRLMRTYRGLAEFYRRKARRTIDGISPVLRQRYRLSLEIIYNLYLQIFERVKPDTGVFTAEELNPPPAQIQQTIESTLAAFQREN
ncbi:MAG: squalene/phytoene synthase family protein [candidate division Zixibacteria bacterium]|nr:squalene/phytoene synthase family protein [candidate division Zixibacteria bacterium]